MNDSINSNQACVNTACYYIVKVLVDPGLPPNVGSYRPIRIYAPSGSCINAKAPAAIGNSTIITAPKIVDVLLGALVHACQNGQPPPQMESPVSLISEDSIPGQESFITTSSRMQAARGHAQSGRHGCGSVSYDQHP